VAVVGSIDGSDAGDWNGAAYVFVRNGERWEEQAKLTASSVAEGLSDHFGWSVAINGDVAIVGSPYDDDAGKNSGSAYVFLYNGDTWEEKKKLTASDAAAGDHFGRSVAIDGDMAIVGSPYDDDAGTSSGSAYVFVRNGDMWEETKKLTARDTAAGDYFGWSVAISGDVVIVGADEDDDAGGDSGSAYVFIRNGDMCEEKRKLTASDATASDYFGYSVAISGDVAIVGSFGDDNAGGNSGSAYIKYYDGCSQ